MEIIDVEYRKKKVDIILKDDVSKEHGELEELAKEVLKIHDNLLKMGFEEVADDVLEIHNNLLGTKRKEVKQDIDKQITKLENLKSESIDQLKSELRTKNIPDDKSIFLIESMAKIFD
jgi:hypothetical protein